MRADGRKKSVNDNLQSVRGDFSNISLGVPGLPVLGETFESFLLAESFAEGPFIDDG